MASPIPAESAAPDQLQLALARTWLAQERTLMAWIRTSTSLITFGFALFKFAVYLRYLEPDRQPNSLFGARAFGLLMIAVGVVTLGLALWQHKRQLKLLEVHYKSAPMSLSLIVAVVIALLGVLAFVETAAFH